MSYLGSKGPTLRLFEPDTGLWTLNSSSSRSGRLFPPVAGRFERGRGEFYGDDALPHREGRAGAVRVVGCVGDRRPLGTGVLPRRRETWLPNWTMDFTRPPVS